jgi:cysteine-rich repeat protein
MPLRLLLLGLLALSACAFGDNSPFGLRDPLQPGADPDAGLDDDDDGGVDPPDGRDAGLIDPNPPRCGDAAVDDGETCDDGNLADGDGCAADCTVEGLEPTSCELVPQTGCPGGACDLDVTGETVCRDAGEGPMGAACASVLDCAAGYTCSFVASQGICSRFCQDDAQCEGNGSLCAYGLTIGNQPVADVSLCSEACDPFSGFGCPAGWACHVSRLTGAGGMTSCAPHDGGGGAGSFCADDLDCGIGLGCVATTEQARCRKYCEVGATIDCKSPQACVGFATPLTIEGFEWGVCL